MTLFKTYWVNYGEHEEFSGHIFPSTPIVIYRIPIFPLHSLYVTCTFLSFQENKTLLLSILLSTVKGLVEEGKASFIFFLHLTYQFTALDLQFTLRQNDGYCPPYSLSECVMTFWYIPRALKASRAKILCWNSLYQNREGDRPSLSLVTRAVVGGNFAWQRLLVRWQRPVFHESQKDKVFGSGYG